MIAVAGDASRPQQTHRRGVALEEVDRLLFRAMQEGSLGSETVNVTPDGRQPLHFGKAGNPHGRGILRMKGGVYEGDSCLKLGIA